jgi:hypothetical protein
MAVGNFIPANVQADAPRLAVLNLVINWASGVASLDPTSYGATSISGSAGEWSVTLRGSFGNVIGCAATWTVEGGQPTCPVVILNSADIQSGSEIDFATMKPTAADNTALIYGDPADADTLLLTLFCLNT